MEKTENLRASHRPAPSSFYTPSWCFSGRIGRPRQGSLSSEKILCQVLFEAWSGSAGICKVMIFLFLITQDSEKDGKFKLLSKVTFLSKLLLSKKQTKVNKY